MRTKHITQSAIIATIYIVLSWIFAPISFSNQLLQVRISESLCVLALFTPSSISGLFLGCALSNILFGSLGIIDLVFGSLATLASTILTYTLRGKSKLIALLPPVLVNAVIVGAYTNYLVSPEINIFINIGFVAVGQILSCYIIGIPLSNVIEKYSNKLI